MKSPDERAAEAIAIQPDPTDRDAIARARRGVAGETVHTREAIANLALSISTNQRRDGIALIREATDRLDALMRRIVELDTMDKTALQAQVDADLPTRKLTPARWC